MSRPKRAKSIVRIFDREQAVAGAVLPLRAQRPEEADSLKGKISITFTMVDENGFPAHDEAREAADTGTITLTKATGNHLEGTFESTGKKH